MAYYNQNPMYNPYYNVNNPLVQQQPIQQPQQQTIQQGGYVLVSSEKEAMDYLVAQGTSVTFIDWTNLKVYLKTRGFSPLEQPIFKSYNLVEKTDNDTPTVEVEYAQKEDLTALQGEFNKLKEQIQKLSKPKKESK